MVNGSVIVVVVFQENVDAIEDFGQLGDLQRIHHVMVQYIPQTFRDIYAVQQDIVERVAEIRVPFDHGGFVCRRCCWIHRGAHPFDFLYDIVADNIEEIGGQLRHIVDFA